MNRDVCNAASRTNWQIGVICGVPVVKARLAQEKAARIEHETRDCPCPGPLKGTCSDCPYRESFTVFWKGEQHHVQGRDREHAKRVLYMAIPEAKWNEIR